MKNVILTGALLLSAAVSALSQGVVTFNNGVLSSLPDRLVRTFESGPLVGTQWAVQLYYGTSATSLAAHTAAPQRFRAPTTTSPGTWSATGASRTLTGGGVGVPVFMHARVWNLDRFATYEAALAGGGPAASSAVFLYTQRLSSPPDTTDTYMDNFTGFTFSILPEPSVTALAILGGLSLVLLRRRGRRNSFTLDP